MLVLKRRVGQSIIISRGDDLIKVKVIDRQGDGVRLGIEADPSVIVNREEIYEEIQKAKAGKNK